jgi:tRNA U34 5-carboxymethylaminomethyl modifying enzyme MnmG/GidA
MKVKVLLAALALVFSAVSFGQDAKKMPSDEQLKAQAMELTEKMTEYLDLNETQVERMKGLNMSLVKKKAEFMAMDASMDEKKEKFENFKKNHVDKLREVLTEDQFEKFKEKFQQTIELKKSKMMDKKM